MKAFLTTAATVIAASTATAVLAHPGHVAPENGHAHGEIFAILAVLLLALGALAWNARQG